MRVGIFEWLDRIKTIDDVFDPKDYDITLKLGEPCIIRTETSDENYALEKAPTFLATIQYYTKYKCFDEKSVASIKEHISIEPKRHIPGMTRCICGMKHLELNINVLRVFNQDRDTSVCFAIGGDCLRNHFATGEANDNLLTKERCKICKDVINRRHKSRPGLCKDCIWDVKREEEIREKQDKYIIKFGKKYKGLTFKYVAENCDDYCKWLLEEYDDRADTWITRNNNVMYFCDYLLQYYYEY
jgi:hypothetical protein